jgi:3-deoxy-D-manno-octulosonic-acid transferase
LNRPVLVFASSREGEEALLLEVLNRKTAPVLASTAQPATKNIAFAVQWLIVPRHPQRFDAVARLCQEQGFSVSRRSHWTQAPEAADIWLGDSMGEMALYFALSDLALLGGSFAPLGGQNLIEAAACGCPVVMGPHTFNFAQAAELARASGAAFEVQDMAQAVDRGLALLQSPAELAKARGAARSLGAAHGGAALRTAEAVRRLLAGE